MYQKHVLEFLKFDLIIMFVTDSYKETSWKNSKKYKNMTNVLWKTSTNAINGQK